MKLYNLIAPLAITALAMVAPVPAQALVLDRTDGTFSNVVDGANPTITDILNGSEVRWGRAATTAGRSGLRFVGIDYAPDLTIVPNTFFDLGTLTHFNFPIYDAASSVDLSVDLSFLDVTPDPLSFLFTNTIDETPNSGTCAYPSVTRCADKITIGSAQQQTVFTYNGEDYTLDLQFMDGDELTDSFISQERRANSAILKGRITPARPQVPGDKVPGPLGIAAVGGAFAWSRKLRNRVKSSI